MLVKSLLLQTYEVSFAFHVKLVHLLSISHSDAGNLESCTFGIVHVSLNWCQKFNAKINMC